MRTYAEGHVPDPSWKSGPPDPPELVETECEDGDEHCNCCDDYRNMCCWCGNQRSEIYEPPEQEWDDDL